MVEVAEAAGVRVAWSDLPASVRAGVEAVLGSPVVEAVTQPGGFSPGSADRVRTADGGRAFVKAVSATANPRSPGLHRQEAAVTVALPRTAPVPTLLGVHDDGTWVALVLADVDGRHPALPWRTDELEAVRRAYEEVATVPLTGALAALPGTGEQLAEDFAGWRRLLAEPDADLDPWAAAHLHRLAATAARAAGVVVGDQLVHGDARADNLLVRPDGTVAVVDWPWASRGAGWFDLVCVLVNVACYDAEAPVEALVADWLPDVPAEDVDAVLAGLAGYFVDVARRPDPPGLPTVRAFQRAQGGAVLAWLRQRWGA
ncbi:Phosphotransferase enzyme family protein [Microlunatus flavus]|uniref:Phosphotransferase enzyme family protein n=1 Tax=Microlunatus flavus TaxID=1036181 RepID=A0A1H9CYR5_9ACTN|nr:Phosphotransferase enzyme family protein [Microlunatus flavus]